MVCRDSPAPAVMEGGLDRSQLQVKEVTSAEAEDFLVGMGNVVRVKEKLTGCDGMTLG